MLRKLFVSLFVFVFAATLAGSAAMMKSGRMVNKVGTIESNACAIMMRKACPSRAELKMEIPVFLPQNNGKYDYSQFNYLAVLPREVQDSLFGKKIKVEGMFYGKTNTLVVHQVSVFEGGRWKTVWTMPKKMMNMMMKPTGKGKM